MDIVYGSLGSVLPGPETDPTLLPHNAEFAQSNCASFDSCQQTSLVQLLHPLLTEMAQARMPQPGSLSGSFHISYISHNCASKQFIDIAWGSPCFHHRHRTL